MLLIIQPTKTYEQVMILDANLLCVLNFQHVCAISHTFFLVIDVTENNGFQAKSTKTL